jgi:ribonuclease J
MSFSVKKHKNDLVFLPLGGSGEIGMNLNLYQYKGKWLMVDLGAGFADDYLPGVDMIVPDIEYIVKHRADLLGIVLTHAHEDHLGAVPYLWRELGVPIYTTKFTASFLKAKLQETNFAKEVPINVVEEGGSLEIGPFSISMVPLNHSTPEMQALVIETDHGKVFHTGDWKFDDDPVIGKANDEKLLKAVGDSGILAMVGDSTNVFQEKHSGSEGDLLESISSLIAGCKQLAMVTTFASNVARLETIMRAAKQNGRKVILAGKSLWRILDAAKENGYLTDLETPLNDKRINDFPRNKLVVIATGCQGEARAATSRIACESHPSVRLKPGDSVIFSSKIIPGNEKKIFRLFNQFVHLGVEAYTEKDHFVHVSGHPSKMELKQMYKLIRPKISVPVHGELVHMREHGRLAKSWGCEQAVQVENGIAIKLAPGEAEAVGKVDTQYLAIDGSCLIPSNSGVMRTRRKIQNDGIVIVTLALNKKNQVSGRPSITAPGLLDSKDDSYLIEALTDSVQEAIDDSLDSRQKRNSKGLTEQNIEKLVRTAVRRVLRAEVGKNPIIEVHTINTNSM